MKKVLVIGASGFVGRRVAQALLAEGIGVRCLSRDPAKIEDLAALGCETVQGDVSDAASVEQALSSVEAVYIAIHTLSPQSGRAAKQRFMAVELQGLRNIVAGCQAQGASRLIYVTSLGIAANSPSEWLRERWRGEEFLLESGLDVTVIRPGMIVGAGGRGFEMLAGQAKKPVAIFLGGQQKMRCIAVDDLIFYLVNVLNDSRAFGQRYDVGNDDVLSNSQMIDANADFFGRRPPLKLPIPLAFLGALAPVLERAARLPSGAFKGFLDSLKADGSGDPRPIRALLPRELMTYRQAVAQAAAQTTTNK